ncbi:MAG: 16S rRNA (cytosine(1402)-N(4))-methyltransferase RsmH [Alphaproteobacteria bacterium]|nr:16S rRNA (cytosine(1402)-N(4))-methyltransferase RsmH [Alphaproteobacteria bacterium]
MTHLSVMAQDVVAALDPQAGEIFVDGTFGRGGYTEALLVKAPCTVWAIDRDPEAIQAARVMAGAYEGRLHVIEGCFGQMDRLLNERGVSAVDGVALDIGVSSPQFDNPQRGFSFRFDGPLDMRMGSEGPTAADLVNELAEEDLANLIYRYGEERHSRRIAKAIVAARPITRTLELAEAVRSVMRKSHDGIDPATRTFQALRIAVNDELEELESGLVAAENLLKPGGRLAVVAFHSLEDRIVKEFLNIRAMKNQGGSRHLPQAQTVRKPSFGQIERRFPSDGEVAANPRARSARLRSAVRSHAPAWGKEGS